MNSFGVDLLDPVHVARATLFLAADARFISGAQLPVDAGASTK